MKPTILLYNPPSTSEERDWVRPLPLNLLSICSLIDEKEFTISITQEFPEMAYKEFMLGLDSAVCLGISCMTGFQILNGLLLAKKIRNVKPALPIIWGGYHPTATSEQTLQNQFVDIIIRGYGEIAFAEIVKRLQNQQGYEDVQGISFIERGKVINTPEGPIPDLNELPALPYHLFDVEEFFKKTGARTLHYISSRGCPNRCGFCADYVIYKRRWNALSAERVISDLERLKKIYNYDSVRFYDSNLFVYEERISEICRGVIEKKLDFKWLKCNGDASVLSKYSFETLGLMNKAGVSNILIGVESGYEPALRCIDKTATIEDNAEAARRLHKHNISIGFSFMFCFPYDLPKEKITEEHRKELAATMKAIASFSHNYLRGDYYLFFIFTPYPGVRLFPRYLKLGFEFPDSFEAWGRVNLNETQSCPWASPVLLRLYNECLQINWFFMHKLERSIFRSSKNRLLRKYVKFYDGLACKILEARVNKEKLTLPVIFKVVLFYYKSKAFIQSKGCKPFVKKVLSLIHRKS